MSRERPKSAPYLRLKSSKMTSKCTSILFYSTRKTRTFLKKSQNAKKTEMGTLRDFSTSILSQNSKKLKEDSLGENCFRKSLAMPKKLKRGPFSLDRYCMLRGKPFWFSSLGQQVQLGVFQNVELSVELFWSLQVYRKKH